MIDLKHTIEAQALDVPRSRDVEGELRFEGKSTVNLTSFSYATIDLNLSVNYYCIAVVLGEEVQPGEYEYTLKDDKGMLSTGILIIGDFDNAVKEYNKTTEYEQYES